MSLLSLLTQNREGGENMPIINFLKPVGDTYKFIGEELRVYIPEDYFEKRLANDTGGYVSVFGLLETEMFKGGKSQGVEVLNMPTMIEIFPSALEPETLSLTGKDGDKTRYSVAIFYNGDSFTNINVRQDSTNVELFFKMMTGGKVLSAVPYDQLLNVWQKNLSMNGINLGVPSTVLEIIIREIYRDPTNPEYTFSNLYNRDPKIDQKSYRSANIREVCARNSNFAAMTFEDMDQMINSSINTTTFKKSQTVSPVEKIIKM